MANAVFRGIERQSRKNRKSFGAIGC